MATTYVFRIERTGSVARRSLLAGPFERRDEAYAEALGLAAHFPAWELQVMSLSERRDIERAESLALSEALAQ